MYTYHQSRVLHYFIILNCYSKPDFLPPTCNMFNFFYVLKHCTHPICTKCCFLRWHCIKNGNLFQSMCNERISKPIWNFILSTEKQICSNVSFIIIPKVLWLFIQTARKKAEQNGERVVGKTPKKYPLNRYQIGQKKPFKSVQPVSRSSVIHPVCS